MDKFTLVTKEYEECYLQGWDARMSDLFVNPFLLDFESFKYQAWKDGWHDAEKAIEEDDDGTDKIY